jgi:hypothetical protein
MRCLPFTMTGGALLTQVVREAHQNPNRSSPCACCGARIRIKPDRADQTVRCASCLRVQRVSADEETPWRLTAASAEALRRTRSWVRWIPA